MPRKKKAPDLTFQRHIADYLIGEAQGRIPPPLKLRRLTTRAPTFPQPGAKLSLEEIRCAFTIDFVGGEMYI
jgi:hypothetical protein